MVVLDEIVDDDVAVTLGGTGISGMSRGWQGGLGQLLDHRLEFLGGQGHSVE